MKVNMIGRNWNTRAWTGSVGAGFSFCCMYIVTPMISGQMPILKKCRNSGTCQGNRPKPVMMVSGSGALRSLIQPKNG